MNNLTIVKDHYLGKREASSRVENFAWRLRSEHGDKISNVRQDWNSSHDELEFSLNAYGFDVSGKLVVRDYSVQLEAELPLIAKLLEGKIRSIIEAELDRLFA